MTREPYPGELERQRCARRTRAELRDFKPARPMAFADVLQIRWQLARCTMCNACPSTLNALRTLQGPADPAPGAEIVQLRRTA